MVLLDSGPGGFSAQGISANAVEMSISVDCEGSMADAGMEDMSLVACGGGLNVSLRIVCDSRYDATSSGSTLSRGRAGSDLAPATPRER